MVVAARSHLAGVDAAVLFTSALAAALAQIVNPALTDPHLICTNPDLNTYEH